MKNYVFHGQKRFLFLLESQKASFLVSFWSNLSKEKWHCFDQKHGLTPLKKNAIFWTLKSFVFLGSKKVSFSLQIKKALFLVLFWSNLSKEKMAFFCQKHGLTPLKKFESLVFEKRCFFIVKKGFFFLCKVVRHYL